MKNDALVIQVSHLGKVYKTGLLETVALIDVSFEVRRGEYVAIMGPSGSGKSTLMHIIGALDRPTSGQYLLEGQNVSGMSDDQLADIRNQKIGFIFQAYNLLARTSALRNVMLPMSYADVSQDKQLETARKFLSLVGLADRMDHKPNQLSGGEQQRVAIARALSLNPAILLADEPTGNIASLQAEEIMSIFGRLNREGHTVIMITHEPGIAKHAQRIIHLKDGKIDQDIANHHQIIKKITD